MRKYYVIEGHDKVYTEREFANLSYWFKGERHKCLGTFKNRKEAEKAWLDEIEYGIEYGKVVRLQRRTKMKYFIVDDNTTKGAIVTFSALKKAKTAEAAIVYGWTAWDYLTRNEKKARDAFYVVFAEEDEDGAPDMNTAEMVVDIKAEWLKKERS